MTPWLLLKGNKKKINGYAEKAKEEGLEVKLYTDIVDVEIKLTASDKDIPAKILTLPDHLKKTALTVYQLGRATAGKVAEQTKRARALESDYLNQLNRMGYLKREKEGREVYFYIEIK